MELVQNPENVSSGSEPLTQSMALSRRIALRFPPTTSSKAEGTHWTPAASQEQLVEGQGVVVEVGQQLVAVGQPPGALGTLQTQSNAVKPLLLVHPNALVFLQG